MGETLSTNEVIGLNVGVNQGIQVTAPAIATVAGATAIRVYYGILTENQWPSQRLSHLLSHLQVIQVFLQLVTRPST